MSRRKFQFFTSNPGDPAPIALEIQHVVTFSEVDALGIAWHGHCPRFFELAHTELMRKIGLTYEEYKKYNVGAPIVQCHIDYFVPLLLDETITVRADVVWSDGARINVNYLIKKQDGQIACSGYTVQMLFDITTRKPFIFAPEPVQNAWDKWKQGEI